MDVIRPAAGFLTALILAGCAGERLSFGNSTPETRPEPNAAMAGRWMLAAPNAPPCGMNFGGAPGAREGSVAPEGGCPGRFFLSRRWALEQNALVIIDDDNNSLAQFNFADGRYEGKSTAGTPVTLAR